MEIGIFDQPRLHFQIFSNSLKTFENLDFCSLAFIGILSNGKDGLAVRHVWRQGEGTNSLRLN